MEDRRFEAVDEEFQTFVNAICEVFHNEPWSVVEPSAQRIWGALDLALPWSEVEPSVRERWPY